MRRGRRHSPSRDRSAALRWRLGRGRGACGSSVTSWWGVPPSVGRGHIRVPVDFSPRIERRNLIRLSRPSCPGESGAALIQRAASWADNSHVRLPGLDTNNALRPAVEGFVAQTRSRRPEPLDARERNVEVARIVVLAAAVVGLAAVTDEAPSLDVGLALALTAAYALAGLVRFEVGLGEMVPTQVVFVPMLLLLPPWAVPVAVAAGTVLSDLPAVLQFRIHPDRLLIAPANAWYAVGPALVLALAGNGGPTWQDVQIYAIAFVAQVVFDVAAATVRDWFVFRVPPRLQVAVLARVYVVDALLTPVGLLAAFGAGDNGYRALLVLPLVALLAVFAQERSANIENAIQLSTAYRGTALLLGDVLEDKD